MRGSVQPHQPYLQSDEPRLLADKSRHAPALAPSSQLSWVPLGACPCMAMQGQAWCPRRVSLLKHWLFARLAATQVCGKLCSSFLSFRAGRSSPLAVCGWRRAAWCAARQAERGVALLQSDWGACGVLHKPRCVAGRR